MKVKAVWLTTERHSAVVDVPDEENVFDYLADGSVLAAAEEARTYEATIERDLIRWEEIEENGAKDG